MDTITAKRGSWNMSRIRAKDTKPERLVRSLLHCMCFRFRRHRRDLPGTPDIVLPGRRTVVLVNGCYWHRHEGCRSEYTPKSNREFWQSKFDKNVARDRLQNAQLRQLGWQVVTVWECETKDPCRLRKRLQAAIAPSSLAVAQKG